MTKVCRFSRIQEPQHPELARALTRIQRRVASLVVLALLGRIATGCSSQEPSSPIGDTDNAEAGASGNMPAPAAGGGAQAPTPRAGASGSTGELAASAGARAGVAGTSVRGGAPGSVAGASGAAGSNGAAGMQAAHGAGGMLAPSAAAGAGSMHAGAWRIMPLGDSITDSTCVTQLLFNDLRTAGYTNFDLVGTRKNQQSCGVMNPDQDCEGHSGYLVTDLVGNGAHANEMSAWFSSDRADLVLMHFGTNDAWHNDIAPDKILSAFSMVIDALRAVQPTVIVFVAQIIPLHPSDCPTCPARVEALNSQIPNWAMSESTQDSPIYVVDQFTGFDAMTDTAEGVHPNLMGAQKMADVWTAALRAHGIF
jgi:lysophospholipase L1-like esterase